MKYLSMTVKTAMKQITQNEIYLPAIQRKFIWNADRIESLFDSIMRGYPIGTFLFWQVIGDTRDEYTFYKFIQDYHERDRAVNEIAPSPFLQDHFIGVLDGQQRLNSMYVALQGSYSYKTKHGRNKNDASFPKRQLYVNLFYQPSGEEDDAAEYQFQLLTDSESSELDATHYWFPVRDVLAWPDIRSVFNVISKANSCSLFTSHYCKNEAPHCCNFYGSAYARTR